MRNLPYRSPYPRSLSRIADLTRPLGETRVSPILKFWTWSVSVGLMSRSAIDGYPCINLSPEVTGVGNMSPFMEAQPRYASPDKIEECRM
jgi:hypothetical protein